MLEKQYEVKTAKNIIILFSCIFLFGIVFFGGLAIYFSIMIAKEDFSLYEEPATQMIMSIICTCFSFIMFVIIIVAWIFFLRETKRQVDIYTKDRMYRQKGEKIIFELEYKKIESIKEGMFAILIFCSEPIKKLNGKLMAKTLIEYYTREDITKIQQIISDYKAENNIITTN